MNPNELRELADTLEDAYRWTDACGEASAYLREQADRQERGAVAWGMPDMDGAILDVIDPDEHARHEGGYTVPLYLHPAPQSVPAGYWLAPMETTAEMRAACRQERAKTPAPSSDDVWAAMRDAYIANPAAPAEGVNEWTGIARAEQIAGEASEDYVFEGDAGCYTPTDGERFMLLDFVMGLLADDEFVSAIRAAPAAPAPADVVEALRELIEAAKNAIHAGRQIEHYEHPSVRPLSENNFRFYESARKTEIRLERAMTSARAALAAADQKEPTNG